MSHWTITSAQFGFHLTRIKSVLLANCMYCLPLRREADCPMTWLRAVIKSVSSFSVFDVLWMASWISFLPNMCRVLSVSKKITCKIKNIHVEEVQWQQVHRNKMSTFSIKVQIMASGRHRGKFSCPSFLSKSRLDTFARYLSDFSTFGSTTCDILLPVIKN